MGDLSFGEGLLDRQRVFITGGTGTLGHALLSHIRDRELESRVTLFSRDTMRHMTTKSMFPDLKINNVVGDVRDVQAVHAAMAGHDIVIHAAAMKHIPQSELDPESCYRTNVEGSRNVLNSALLHRIKRVMLISTDKAAAPVNAYGCTKMMMERLAWHYARKTDIQVYLPRYGNVVASNGSVATVWRKQVAAGEPITLTDPRMTRFWLSPEQAIDVILESLRMPNCITAPLLPALSMGKLAKYLFPNVKVKTIGLRQGEKMHEELVTAEESVFATPNGSTEYAFIRDTTGTPRKSSPWHYRSSVPMRCIKRQEARELFGVA